MTEKNQKKTKKIICFDIDLTLITDDRKPIYDHICLLMCLSELKNTEIHLWSGGGGGYAQQWGEKLGLDHIVTGYWDKSHLVADTLKPDLTFDDQEITLGSVNIQIPTNSSLDKKPQSVII